MRGDAVSADLPETLLAAIDAIVQRFAAQRIDAALIGGVAVSLHGLVRATKDLDLLVDDAQAAAAEEILRELGFTTLGRNQVFGNYLLGPLRVDLLFTQGRHTREMLARAPFVQLRRGAAKLARPEDLIGLKLQALANRPERPSDAADIRLLLQRFVGTMDMSLVREYFALFGKEAELDALLQAVGGSPTGHAG